jgi:rhamnose utilization protein RhaD (predicted bifunctional aldolase and dehydrogenase)
MILPTKTIKDSVIAYCAHIGADPMLVQAAGGNVSWKDGATLWVKASGTWLANAAREEIFVAVELTHLQRAIAEGDFDVSPRVCEKSSLRPSIETLLHAMMPHKVVVHLHPVEILARLVRSNSEEEIISLVGESLRWLSVSYFRPGAELARGIHESMKRAGDIDVVFLRNHGVVVGGASVEEVDDILRRLTTTFNTPPNTGTGNNSNISRSNEIEELGYQLTSNQEVNNLIQDQRFFEQLKTDWALYPDHVVFLGPKAFCFDCTDDFISSLVHAEYLPELVFVRSVGVFEHRKISESQKVQIQCYKDVMSRQSPNERLNPLTDENITQLLNWEAETYRIQISLE